MKSFRRTWIAAALVAGAVLLPLGAWYGLGSRGVQREVALLSNTAELRLQQTTEALARRAADRLDALREVESRRPFFHYQTHFHDPQSDCACASVTSSPLAHGPRDPAIWVYVQVDPEGHVSLPTLEESLNYSGGSVWLGTQAEILARVTPEVLNALAEPLPLEPSRRELVSLDSWTQNMELAGVQCDVATIQAAVDSMHDARGREPTSDEVLIEIGPMLWRTLSLPEDHCLAAFRRIETPTGNFVQGFIVEPGRLGSMLEDAGMPAALAPGSTPGAGSSRLPLSGVDWHARVDGSLWLNEAASAGSIRVAGFRRTFFLGSLAALVAAGTLVLLIWQTERLSEQRSRFAAAAAHELRTPLAGLRLYSDLLGQSLGNPTRTQEYAQRLSFETERMGLVVSNILGFARMERRGDVLPTESRDLVADIHTFLKDMEPALSTSGVHIHLEAAQEHVHAMVNRDAMAHIVQNLVDNAEKHCREAANRDITISISSTPDAATVAVRDNGPGVPVKYRGKVFDPFTGSSTSGGLGLGLSLVRTLAEAQQGRAWYRAAEQGGSVFGVSVPLPA